MAWGGMSDGIEDDTKTETLYEETAIGACFSGVVFDGSSAE